MKCSKCEEEKSSEVWYKKRKTHEDDEVQFSEEWLCQSCYDNLSEKEQDNWRPANTSSKIRKAYGPLKKHLKKLSLKESLWVLGAYLRSLEQGMELPKEIQVPEDIKPIGDLREGDLYQWELEVLIRETIINAQEDPEIATQTLKDDKYFLGALGKLRKTKEEIDKLFLNENNVEKKMHMVTNKQFLWQVTGGKDFFTRYFKIFRKPSLAQFIEENTGYSTRQIYQIGMYLWGYFRDNHTLNLPAKVQEISEVTAESMDQIIQSWSLELSDLKRRLKENQSLDENFSYSYSALKEYPLISFSRGEQRFIGCPVPTFLKWRFASGLYYDLVDEEGFGNKFGDCFQEYVGEVLEKIKSDCKIYPEREYDEGENRTVDWIVEAPQCRLFLEAKTKRLPIAAKNKLSKEELEESLEKLAEAVTQTYKNIDDYLRGTYPFQGFQEEKQIYPVVVTLEDWFIFGGRLQDKLNYSIKKKLEAQDLPTEYLSDMPYLVCSSRELESMVRIISKIDPSEFMKKKIFDEEKRSWTLGAFMSQLYSDHLEDVEPLFPEVFDEIFPDEALNE